MDFMAWIKAELMAGHHVTMGVLDEPAGYNLPYAHIVNVVRVDTNNASAPYDGSDVMYIDDHGLYTCGSKTFPCSGGSNPAIPPGSGSDAGCAPFNFGYTFDAWQGPTFKNDQNWIIPLPTEEDKNYAYSVYGIAGKSGSEPRACIREFARGITLSQVCAKRHITIA